MSPIDPSRYPADWKAISLRIRHERAGNRCECDGRCRSGRCTAWQRVAAMAMDAGIAPPYTELRHWGARCAAVNGEPHPSTTSRVVLTVAHLDHALTDHSDANLMALCQACHLAYDAQQHAATRAANQAGAGAVAAALVAVAAQRAAKARRR